MKYKNKYLALLNNYNILPDTVNNMKGGGEILNNAFIALNKIYHRFSVYSIIPFMHELASNSNLLKNINIPYSFALTMEEEANENILYILTITDLKKMQ